MKLNVLKYTALMAALTALPSQAAQLEISLSNLSHGNYFTPILVAAHQSDIMLYRSGTTASAALVKMAEGEISRILRQM